ncbi:hypothetical protein AZJ59_11140, partial [Streptococcus pneumoniae]
VSYVESRLDDAPPIDLDIITNFDDIFYKTYLFLDSDEEQKKFINFRNVLRYQAGYPHPDGLYIWDVQFEEQSYAPDTIEEPRYIFDRLNECLLIANKHINDKLHIQSSANCS